MKYFLIALFLFAAFSTMAQTIESKVCEVPQVKEMMDEGGQCHTLFITREIEDPVTVKCMGKVMNKPTIFEIQLGVPEPKIKFQISGPLHEMDAKVSLFLANAIIRNAAGEETIIHNSVETGLLLSPLITVDFERDGQIIKVNNIFINLSTFPIAAQELLCI